MILIVARVPNTPETFWHSFGPEGELLFTQLPAKAKSFASIETAHAMRESSAFWQGLEAGAAKEIAIGVATYDRRGQEITNTETKES